MDHKIILFFVMALVSSSLVRASLITINAPKIDSILPSDIEGIAHLQLGQVPVVRSRGLYVLITSTSTNDEYVCFRNGRDITDACSYFGWPNVSRKVFFAIFNPDRYPQLADLPRFQGVLTN